MAPVLYFDYSGGFFDDFVETRLYSAIIEEHIPVTPNMTTGYFSNLNLLRASLLQLYINWSKYEKRGEKEKIT